MKKTIFPKLILIILIFTIFPTQSLTFTFSSYKTTGETGGVLRTDFLQELIRIFNVDILIETGTAGGGTILQAINYFPAIYTIELDEALYQAGKERLKKCAHVHTFKGESGDILQQLLPSITGKPLFWLDAHYCGEGSAWGRNETPILDELEAIKCSHIQDCVILIDDMRGFGTHALDKDFICWPNYPTMQELCQKLLNINNDFNIILLGDVLLAYDKTKYTIDLSPITTACTASRIEFLYSDQELLHYESIIGSVQEQERAFIDILYNNKKGYPPDHEYHIHLWRGLILLHDKLYEEALQEFNHVISQGYHHWRVYRYAAQAAAGGVI